MENNLHTDKIIKADIFQGYIRSFAFFLAPIITFISSLVFTSFFGYIAWEAWLEREYAGFAIIIAIASAGLFTAGLSIHFLYASACDARDLKVRVRLVEVKKVISTKNALALSYLYQKKQLVISIPRKWKVKGDLPQQAVLYTTYRSNRPLKLELLESDESFSILFT